MAVRTAMRRQGMSEEYEPGSPEHKAVLYQRRKKDVQRVARIVAPYLLEEADKADEQDLEEVTVTVSSVYSALNVMAFIESLEMYEKELTEKMERLTDERAGAYLKSELLERERKQLLCASKISLHTIRGLEEQVETAEKELETEQGRWQEAIYKLACELAPDAQIDGGGCDSGDPLDLTLDEISQAFSYWDNLLFDSMESVSHAKIEGSTFKAAAAMITSLAADNEATDQKVCDECSGDGWVHNRVEGRGACTCMIEAEPFQILLKALEKIADPDAARLGIGCAMEALDALRTVLPLDYPDNWKPV